MIIIIITHQSELALKHLTQFSWNAEMHVTKLARTPASSHRHVTLGRALDVGQPPTSSYAFGFPSVPWVDRKDEMMKRDDLDNATPGTEKWLLITDHLLIPFKPALLKLQGTILAGYL